MRQCLIVSLQNQVYCQVGLHIQGICFGVLMQYSKQLVVD